MKKRLFCRILLMVVVNCLDKIEEVVLLFVLLLFEILSKYPRGHLCKLADSV